MKKILIILFFGFLNTIYSQIDSSLRASAGVSQLAGCGSYSGGLDSQGKIRITNVEGGTPGYTYSFDNKDISDGTKTWINENESVVNPGTYTVYVKDSKGEVYAMPNILLEPALIRPKLEFDPVVYNCDGTGKVNFKIKYQGKENYLYETYLDGKFNFSGSKDTFTIDNLAPTSSGSIPHSIQVNFNSTAKITYSSLLNEDFGSGEDVKLPGINPAYCWEKQDFFPDCGDGNNLLSDGKYVVTKELLPIQRSWFAWVIPKDHTSNGTNNQGRYLAVNIGDATGSGGILYKKTIVDIVPNQDIKVELYALNLLQAASLTKDAPNLTIELHKNGVAIPGASINTGEIVQNEEWNLINLSINPGNNTTLDFVIRSNSTKIMGNDLAIDDIRVYQVPKNCQTELFSQINVETNKVFKAQVTEYNVSCGGKFDGGIEIKAENFDEKKGFTYSIDNGITWNTSLKSPVSISNLAAGSYNIIVKKTDDNFCNGFSDEITINAPPVLGINAYKKGWSPCDLSASIKADAYGGKPNYKYELRKIDGTVVRAFQSSDIFNDVLTGDYVVVVNDASSCDPVVSDIVSIVVATKPKAVLDVASDLCYTLKNKATLVVKVTGGKSPYRYNLDNTGFRSLNEFKNADSESYTIKNVGSGSHTISVIDANSCSADPITEIQIAAELKAEASVIKTLDCTISPKAKIRVTASQGTPEYTYEVFDNDKKSYVAMTTNIYETDTPGSYLFRVTDSKKCSFITQPAVVNSLVEVTAGHQVENPICSDGKGSVKLYAKTGIPPFKYSFNGAPFSYTDIYGDLPAGNYSYTVKDSKDCEVNSKVTITAPPKIDVKINVHAISCNSTIMGSIVVNVNSGGKAPYTYNLYNNGNTSTPIASYVENSNAVTPMHSFSGLDYGEYFIYVEDANNCRYESNKLKITAPPNLEKGKIGIGLTCEEGISVELKNKGGISDFTYSIVAGDRVVAKYGPTAETSHTFEHLDQNTAYTFKVVDATDCPSYLSFTTPAISSLKISFIKPENVTCFNEENGKVNFTVEDYGSGVTQLNYEIKDFLTNVPIVPAKKGSATGLTGSPFRETIKGLKSGNYTLYVQEADGSKCLTTASFEIKQPARALEASVKEKSNANCNNGALVRVEAKGGTGPYRYGAAAAPGMPSSFDDKNVLELSYSTSTKWNIVVKDANDCVFPLNNVEIAEDPLPSGFTASVTSQCPDDGNYEIVVDDSKAVGMGPFQYNIGGVSQTSKTFKVNRTGTYNLTVSDKFGCTNTFPSIVKILEPLEIRYEIVTLPSCKDGDGVVKAFAKGGSDKYSYAINNIKATKISTTPAEFGDLTVGSYTISVTDLITNCTTFSDEFTLDAATPVTGFKVDSTPETCNGSNDGTITASLTPARIGVNDNPGYRYRINNGTLQDSPYFDGLKAGKYTVEVISGRGCSDSKTVNVDMPNLIVAKPTVVQYRCDTNNKGNFATITVKKIGCGDGIYTYEFVKGTEVVYKGPENVFTEKDYKGGHYFINVYDSRGRKGSVVEPITIDPFVKMDNIVIKVDKPITCVSKEDITITAKSTEGVIISDLNYILKGINGTVYGPIQNNTGIFKGLNVGIYSVMVNNLVTGCTIEDVYSILEPNTFEIKAVPTSNKICYGSTDGSVELSFIDNQPNPADDSGAFTYIISGPISSSTTTTNTHPVSNSATTTNAGPITISNLAAGEYSVIAKLVSGSECTAQTFFKIEQQDAPLTAGAIPANVTCKGGNNGKITVNATGGSGSYKYAVGPKFKQFFDKNVLENLKPGLYSIQVQDESKCNIFIENIEIKEPDQLLVFEIPNSIIPEICAGDKDGQFSIEITGGNAPYSASLDNKKGPFLLVNGNTVDYKGLTGGKHTVYIVDKNDCNTEVEIKMPEAAILDPNYDINYDCVNNAQSNIVTITVDKNNTDLSQVDYSLDSDAGPYQVSNIFANVTPGRHYIVARHTNGCKVPTSSFDIKAYDPLTLVLTRGQQEMNIISVTAAGGAHAYEYSFNGEPFSSSSKYKIYKSGDYVIIVRDKNGCTVTLTVPAIYIDVCLDNYFTPAGSTNTLWGPGCTNIYNNLTFSIFDRYGRVIAKYRYGQKWDGKYNGEDLPSGDYWYVLKLNDENDGREFVGHFTLYR